MPRWTPHRQASCTRWPARAMCCRRPSSWQPAWQQRSALPWPGTSGCSTARRSGPAGRREDWFWRSSRRHPQPGRSQGDGGGRVPGANLAVVVVFAAASGASSATLYLQRVPGFNSMRTGRAFLPGPVVSGMISLFFTTKLTARSGIRITLMTGLLAIAAATASSKLAVPWAVRWLAFLLGCPVIPGVAEVGAGAGGRPGFDRSARGPKPGHGDRDEAAERGCR
jgi:hypothetical protein